MVFRDHSWISGCLLIPGNRPCPVDRKPPGGKTDPRLLAEVSLEKHIPENLPPVFVWHTLDDDSVKVENSFRLVEALKAKNIAVEALFYPHGRHGLSVADATSAFADMDPLLFAKENKHVSTWFQIAVEWLGSIEHN